MYHFNFKTLNNVQKYVIEAQQQIPICRHGDGDELPEHSRILSCSRSRQAVLICCHGDGDTLSEHSRIFSLNVPESVELNSSSVRLLNDTDLYHTVTQEGATKSHTVLSIHSSFVVLPAQVFFTYQGQENMLVPNVRMILLTVHELCMFTITGPADVFKQTLTLLGGNSKW